MGFHFFFFFLTSEVPKSLDEWEQIQSLFPKLPPTSVEQDMVVTDVHEIYTIKYSHIYIFSLTFMLFCD